MDLTEQIIANRYKVLRLLGEGAMGAVYLAEDTELSRQVALKVLRPEIASMPDVHRRLDNECKIQAKIGPHPHMVTLFDKIVGENVILVMEYVPGENLADILDRTRILNAPENSNKTAPVSSGTPLVALDQASAIQIAIQCLDALDFAHSRGILHRDVKPSNILIMRDHNGKLVAKLMDFGIAKAISGMGIGEAMTSFTMVGGPGPGTPLYMSPEQIDSQRFGEPSASSDVYSMGVTLYEMLTLATPFSGTFTELINYHTNIEPPDPSTKCPMLSGNLKAVLAKALKKLPQERYQSAADFKLDLQASGGGTMIYGGQSYTAPVSMGTDGKIKKTKVASLPQLLGALAIFLLVGAVAAYVMSSQPDPQPEPPVPTPTVGAPTPVPPTPPTPSPTAAPPTPTQGPTPVPPTPDTQLQSEAESARLEAQAGRTAINVPPNSTMDTMAKANKAISEGENFFWKADALAKDGKYVEARRAYQSATEKYKEATKIYQTAPPPTPDQNKFLAEKALEDARQVANEAEDKAVNIGLPKSDAFSYSGEEKVSEAEELLKQGRYEEGKTKADEAKKHFEWVRDNLKKPEPHEAEPADSESSGNDSSDEEPGGKSSGSSSSGSGTGRIGPKPRP